MHTRQSTQTIPCISRTVRGQSGHSLLQESMPDDEELDCVASKRKVLNWTPLAWLNSLSHHTGFSTSVDFNKTPWVSTTEPWPKFRIRGGGGGHFLREFKDVLSV